MGLAESLKLAQETLLQAQIALQTDRTAARQAELRAAIAAAETDLAALRRRAADLATALTAEVTAMRTLRDLLHRRWPAVPHGVGDVHQCVTYLPCEGAEQTAFPVREAAGRGRAS